MYTIHPQCEVIFEEKNFGLFKHAGFICAVSRMPRTGCLNGYVAIPEDHKLYGIEWSDEVEVADVNAVEFNGNFIGLLCVDAEKAKENIIRMDVAVNVHYGLTYSRDHLYNIENELFGKLWWFGFDTSHAGDLQPIQDDISRRYSHFDDSYKNWEFVEAQTKSLAEQLAKF